MFFEQTIAWCFQNPTKQSMKTGKKSLFEVVTWLLKNPGKRKEKKKEKRKEKREKRREKEKEKEKEKERKEYHVPH